MQPTSCVHVWKAVQRRFRRPCIVHMRVFGNVAYAMVPNEKRGKLNACERNQMRTKV